MKILIAAPDAICSKQMSLFQDAGIEIVRCPKNDREKIVELSQDATVIMLHGAGDGAEINADMIRRFGKSVKCIVQMFIGFENIDVKAATDRGIMVCNNPRYSTQEVATMAMALLLSIIRKITAFNESMHAGDWNARHRLLFKPYGGRRLSTMTFGVMGFGNIGRHVAKFAQGFDMNVIAYDPYLPESAFEKAGVKKVEMDELLEKSDAITIHIPLMDSTYHLVDEEAISKMKDGVFLVNTSRGPLIDESALTKALLSGKIAAAGLDVFENMPLPADHPFTKMDNIVLTPHIAFASNESFIEIESLSAEIAIAAAKGEVPYSCVNRRELGL